MAQNANSVAEYLIWLNWFKDKSKSQIKETPIISRPEKAATVETNKNPKK